MLQMLLLSSCNEQKDISQLCHSEERPLEIIHDSKIFVVSPKNSPSFVVISGIWKTISRHNYGLLITNGDTIDTPHAVEINCDKDTKSCTLKETIIGKGGVFSEENYYFTSEDVG